jgi:hypothetical protein
VLRQDADADPPRQRGDCARKAAAGTSRLNSRADSLDPADTRNAGAMTVRSSLNFYTCSRFPRRLTTTGSCRIRPALRSIAGSQATQLRAWPPAKRAAALADPGDIASIAQCRTDLSALFHRSRLPRFSLNGARRGSRSTADRYGAAAIYEAERCQ